MSEMLQLQNYIRRFSLFKKSQLEAPIVYPISLLQLPRRSILHYISYDGVTLGPQVMDTLLRRVPGVIYVDNTLRYGNKPIGSPSKKPGSNPDTLVTEYRKRNRSLRPLKSLMRLETDDRSLVVYNYSMLAHLVKYAASFRAGYYMWYNMFNELVTNVNNLAPDTNRSQFIELDLPEVIPPLTVLRQYRDGSRIEPLKQMRTAEELTLADVFVWAGKERSSSILGKIHPQHYDKVNLLVRRLNGWVVLNLGWLDKFRKNFDVGRKEGMEYAMFELRLLKLLTVIHQATSPIYSETADKVLDELQTETDNLDDLLGELTFDDEEEVVPEGEEEMGSDDDIIARLEKELEELDRIKELSSHVEVTDEDGELLDGKTIDVDVLSQSGIVAKEGEAMINKANELAGRGLVTAAEHRRLIRVSEAYKTLPDPYGSDMTFEEAIKIPDEDIYIEPNKLTTDACVTDHSLRLSRVDAMDQQYVDKGVIKKDIMRCIAAVQKSAVSITAYSVHRITDAMNDQEIHTVKFVPAVGIPSTVKFPMPVVKPNGTFLYNGTHYRMRKQRSDLPFRKISPVRVALSSYYAKVFVERSERKRFSYGKWLISILEDKLLDREDPHVRDAIITDVADYKSNTPMAYSTIASLTAGFKVGELELWFDYRRRQEKFEYNATELSFEKAGWVLCGRGPRGALVMDQGGVIYEIIPHDRDGTWYLGDIGTVESLLDIDVSESPTFMAEMKIYSKSLPVGVSLAYLLGLDGLLETLGVKPRRVLVGERMNLDKDEYSVRFKNESLIFKRADTKTAMIMSGFNLYRDVIRNYDISLFNEKDVYAAVLDRSKVGSRYLRELDSMNTLFIDPITEDLLVWMKEPTTYTGLLIRAVEVLQNNYVITRRKDSDKRVESLERIRGYERIPGAIYEALSKSVRLYNARAATGRASVQMNPNDPINAIVRDPTTSPVNNINPVHSLREREVLTYSGRGGRSRRAMVASARLFTDEDMGFISEGTVDSGDVAIITYLSPNSNVTSVRGTVRVYDPERDGPSSIMSTAALLSVGADGDDPKRVNFITVQHGHGIKADGYEVQGVRTGMERAMVSRMGPEFAATAQGDGEVIERSDEHIAVQYKGGKVERFPLGLIHTTAEGSVYPNTLASGMQKGDKVKQFDVLTYNSGFFKPSALNPRRVDYMSGCVGRVALREATYTVEDSASISEAFAVRMTTQVSKLKSVRVDFRQEVTELVSIGQHSDLDTILCTIEDAISADAGLYDEQTRATLRAWAAMAPRAKAVGVIAKIEVFYNGDVEDMSDTLQRIVDVSEKFRRRNAKLLGVEYTTGQVGRNVRIDGNNLEEGQAIIQVYITTPGAMGIGDKLVIGNQMKSTVGEILFGDNRTLANEIVDLIFGAKSCVDRIVTSPFVIGTTNTVDRFIGEEAFKMYFGDVA